MPPGEAASEPGCVYTCQHMEGIYIYLPCAARYINAWQHGGSHIVHQDF